MVRMVGTPVEINTAVVSWIRTQAFLEFLGSNLSLSESWTTGEGMRLG